MAAPDLRKKEQLELFRILLDDKNVVYGFKNKQIRSQMKGNPKTAKIAYELRKLRERGAIKRAKDLITTNLHKKDTFGSITPYLIRTIS